ncbi:MAG TPA: carboxypeptidase-like regulatory domain-containing protein [Candidatus Cybelea sp.]|nr:carboxypeptidase-like regulatory domain-containing protein [Candidatus Cybelea sp.]
MSTKWVFLATAIAVGLSLPTSTRAQTAASATVVGTVSDQSNANVPGATLKLTNLATSATLTVTANEAGQYTFPTVRPGSYTLEATKEGFSKATVQNLAFDIAKSYTVNVTMHLGSLSQTVTVEAASTVQLETTTSQVGNVINNSEIDQLPTLQHDATELIALQPAVSPGFGNSTFPMPDVRSAGAMDDQNTYTLDGIDISDNLVGAGTWIPVLEDSVQEFDFGVSNPNATFGRSSGGQVAMLARHGTNDYHGSVYWFTQNSDLNANTWDNDSAGIPQPHLEDNRGGARIGGPIIKNKTFFFANYELRRFPQSSTITKTVPTDSLKDGILKFQDAAGNIDSYDLATSTECGPTNSLPCDPRGIGISPAVGAFWKLMPEPNYPAVGDGLTINGAYAPMNYEGFRGVISTPLDQDFGVFRLDHNFTDKWRFAGSYNYYRSTQPGTQTSIVNGNLQSVDQSPTRAVLVTGQLTTLISPTITNTFSFGWVRNWQNFQVLSPAGSAAILATKYNVPGTASGITADPYIALNPAEGLLDAPIDNNATDARFQDYFQKSVQFTDGVDWTRGKHSIQFGTDDRRLPLKNDRADKVVGGITSLVAVMDTPDGRGEFLTIPAADAPPVCGGGVSANCLQPGDVGRWNQLYAGTLGLLDSNSILAVRDGSLNPLPYGTPLSNTTVNDSFYFWAQDSWRLTNSLTLNYGLAYGWQTPPTDILGRQTILENATTGQFITAPEYLGAKLSNALAGNIYNPPQGYVPVHDAHSSVFNTDWGDWAPRASVAWNPGFDEGLLSRIFGNKQTVFRGGYSRVFDRESTIETVVIPMLGVGFGETINTGTPIPSCAASGAAGAGCNAGVSGTNPGAGDFRVGVDGAIPLPTETSVSSPIIPSTPFGELLSFQDDPHMVVGRTNAFDVDIQRSLPNAMQLEVGWIGHWASHLPTSVDLDNAPYMFVDTASNQSFAQAFDAVAKELRAGQPVTPQPFFENQIGGYGASQCGGGSATACLASQDNGALFLNGEVATTFQTMDLYRTTPIADGGPGLASYDNLEALLSELRTYIGTSNYNALIINLQKKTTNGLTFQANYTLSKALDEGLINQDNAGYFNNSFYPKASYGPSLYDRTHTFTGLYVYQLPAGGSHRFHFENNGLDRVISGWSWSGVFTAYSGLPLVVGEGSEVWGVSSLIGGTVAAIPTVDPHSLNASVHNGVTGTGGIGTTGAINIFADPQQAYDSFRDVDISTDKHDGAGQPLRGLGQWNYDMAVHKLTTIHESVTFDFSAQFLNIFNHVNFWTPGLPAAPTGLSLQSPENFGVITNQLVPANREAGSRWIELGLRLSF